MELSLILSLPILVLLVLVVSNVSATGGVFRVQHKFAGQELSLKAFKEHDIHRHGRVLAAIDLPLGGDGKSTGTALYYTKIAIGSPSKDYLLQVDTGSDIFWVKCIQCKNCSTNSGLRYDPQNSTTGQLVNCDAQFCSDMNKGPIPDCLPNLPCGYTMSYVDGSQTEGYFVKDFIKLNRVSGNLKTTSINASVIFGCGVQKSVNLFEYASPRRDGVLGFGASNLSMLSQLASSGIVKKKFAHCLNGVSGGGIFAIGNVLSQVQTTPLILNQTHYNAKLESVTVGKTTLQIPSSVSNTGAIIDSGTTLSYLPREIYEPLMNEITSSQPGLNIRIVQEVFSCFQFSRSVDDAFPTVAFQFANSLTLVIYPHDYLIANNEWWCIGWQNSGRLSMEVNNWIILGDLVLSNKLVIYDLENHTIGWTKYNCASPIKIQDESGSVYEVSPHDISSRSDAQALYLGRPVLMMLLLTALIHTLIY